MVVMIVLQYLSITVPSRVLTVLSHHWSCAAWDTPFEFWLKTQGFFFLPSPGLKSKHWTLEKIDVLWLKATGRKMSAVCSGKCTCSFSYTDDDDDDCPTEPGVNNFTFHQLQTLLHARVHSAPAISEDKSHNYNDLRYLPQKGKVNKYYHQWADNLDKQRTITEFATMMLISLDIGSAAKVSVSLGRWRMASKDTGENSNL